MENIGNTLYSIIGEIGKEKIQSDITLKIELSRKYIQIILDRYNNLASNANDESILLEKLLSIISI